MFVDLLYKMSLIYYFTLYLQKTNFDIMSMLNLTYFLLNTFLKKCHFKLQTGFYSNTVFQSYTDYIVKDERSSIDMLATR